MNDDAGATTEATEAEDPVATSFVDLLSGGLGAATFLFMLFAIMPHLGSVVALVTLDCAEGSCGDRPGQAIPLGRLDPTTNEAPVMLSLRASCTGVSRTACSARTLDLSRWSGSATVEVGFPEAVCTVDATASSRLVFFVSDEPHVVTFTPPDDASVSCETTVHLFAGRYLDSRFCEHGPSEPALTAVATVENEEPSLGLAGPACPAS